MTGAPMPDAAAAPDPALVEHLRRRAARDARAAGGDVSRADLADMVRDMVAEERRILTAAGRDALVEAVVDEALGLGPLEALLRDPDVTEVMVCGPRSVFVERAGRISPAGTRFHDDAHLLHVIDRILAPLGRRVDEASPMVDARLPDGSRVNAVIPPLALDGPALTIRRFAGRALTGDDLVELGTIDRPMLELLSLAVRARRNLLVTGGTGSGKTTTLAALAAFVPTSERLVTIEDAAELRIPLPHVVRLESRPPSLEGAGAVSIRALVRNALRMRPDRIVVGEVRGGEALDMLTAMTTGHEGSLSTLHASSPADAIRRVQTLALMGDLDLPYRAVAEQVASALDLIVHQARLPDGARRVVEVASVAAGPDGARLTTLVSWAPGEGFRRDAPAAEWLARARSAADLAAAA
jgi:pilus assembly protein CpaF